MIRQLEQSKQEALKLKETVRKLEEKLSESTEIPTTLYEGEGDDDDVGILLKVILEIQNFIESITNVYRIHF